MAKRLFKILSAILVTAVIAVGLTACGSTGDPYTNIVDDDYTINSMTNTVEVKENGVAHVEERIDVEFNVSFKHGIYRDLPVNSGEKYRDITVSAEYYGSDVKVEYEFERNNGLLSIRIGSEDVVFNRRDKITYIIKYKLIPPSSSDRYIFNIVGQGFSTEILSADLTLTMPVAISADKAVFYVGKYGETGITQSATLVNDSKTLKLIVNGLDAYEGVTADITMPDGTIKSYVDNEFFFTLIVGILLVIATVIVKMTKGRNDPIVPISNYYPPADEKGKKLTPAELGMLIDNTVSDSDVTSLIYYWASNGLVELSEEDSDMVIVKKAELPESAEEYERIMFNKLFDNRETVKTSELKEKFYSTMDSAKSQVTSKYRGKLYNSSAKTVSTVMSVLSAVFAVAMVLFAYLRISSAYFNIIGLTSIISIMLAYLVGGALANYYLKFKPTQRKILVAAFVVFTFIAVTVAVLPVALDAMGWLEKIILIICVSSVTSIAPFIMRRTDYYNKQLGEIIGFKDFLMLAEKDKLEMLLEENPQYYYDILPYANVLGVSDIWENKFKDLSVPPPTYYNSSDALFSLIVFNSFYRRSNTNFRSAAVSRPASSSRSGGGFGRGGGGGFSGGGFGGGGGRSW